MTSLEVGTAQKVFNDIVFGAPTWGRAYLEGTPTTPRAGNIGNASSIPTNERHHKLATQPRTPSGVNSVIFGAITQDRETRAAEIQHHFFYYRLCYLSY